jgi:hypothetical protein
MKSITLKTLLVLGALTALTGSACAASGVPDGGFLNGIFNNSAYPVTLTQDSAYPSFPPHTINPNGGGVQGRPLQHFGDTIKITNGNNHCVLTVTPGPTLILSPATDCGKAVWRTSHKQMFSWTFT